MKIPEFQEELGNISESSSERYQGAYLTLTPTSEDGGVSFIHSFVRSFIRSFVCSFVHLFVHSLVRLFIHSFIHFFILFIYSFILKKPYMTGLISLMKCSYSSSYKGLQIHKKVKNSRKAKYLYLIEMIIKSVLPSFINI